MWLIDLELLSLQDSEPRVRYKMDKQIPSILYTLCLSNVQGFFSNFIYLSSSTLENLLVDQKPTCGRISCPQAQTHKKIVEMLG